MPFFIPLLLLGCPSGPGDSSDSGGGDPAACSTGHTWTGGNDESPLMNPGEDCVACHASGEGPHFTLAGTVMGDMGDPDDCNGVDGVIVRVTDADGNLTELTTNSAGNFYTNDPITLPYTIELDRDGVTSSMSAEQEDGACAACHTAEGRNGAPGRVVAP